MLCWNSLSIVSKRIGSARFFADELSVILAQFLSGAVYVNNVLLCGNCGNFENLGR